MKWAPFNAVINDKEVISQIDYQNRKIQKPVLSEEQIEELEHTIIESYTSNSLIEVYYIYNSQKRSLIGTISKIDPTTKIITINNTSRIHFNNIIKIFEKNT